jgi:predicted oxidoreductase (fatty acid repression mutant protein)
VNLPFTWSRLSNLAGDPLREAEKRRIQAALNAPTAESWASARTVIISGNSPHTLWQCTERATLSRFPDGTVPGSEQIVQGLCYATAERYAGAGARR